MPLHAAEDVVAAGDVLDDLLAVEEVPSIWSFMATTDSEFFWPVVG